MNKSGNPTGFQRWVNADRMRGIARKSIVEELMIFFMYGKLGFTIFPEMFHLFILVHVYTSF